MKKLVIAFLIAASSHVYAQVGIGVNTPDASAQLDVTSTNKGFLPPRVSLTGTTDATTIASPANGLLVYNTAASDDVVPGYYYYNGSTWSRVTSDVKTVVSADPPFTLNAGNSGQIITTEWGEQPAIPDDLPDGFNCTIINYSNYPFTSNTLSTAQFFNTTTGWNDGNGSSTMSIPSGGTVTLNVVTINGIKCYFVTGAGN